MSAERKRSQVISGRIPCSILVEYDARGKRARKSFNNPILARRFYTVKHYAGRNPTLTKVA